MAFEANQLALLEEISSPSDYWFCRGMEERIINLNGEIYNDIVENVILPLKAMEKEDPTKPVTIYLNTFGGSVLDGLVLCEILDNIKCPVVIEVLGYAFSMGVYILMAGYNNPNVKKVCHNFSFGLLHAGSVSLAGDAKKVRQTQRFNEAIDEKIRNYILTHSKITEEEYETHEDQEWYLYAEDLLKYGIVDEII